MQLSAKTTFFTLATNTRNQKRGS